VRQRIVFATVLSVTPRRLAIADALMPSLFRTTTLAAIV
jgi:hypothetical protein